MDPSLFDQLTLDKIKELSTTFYNRVYSIDVDDTSSEFHDNFGKFFVGRRKGFFQVRVTLDLRLILIRGLYSKSV